MITKKYFAPVASALLILAFVSPSLSFAAGSASISFSPEAGSYKAGQTFDLKIFLDPGSNKIDMVRANLTFPADLLEIKNFSASPAFTFPAGGNSFDNSAGTLSWGAGIPGGTKSPVTFGTITFNVKKAGSAKVSLSASSMALAAGVNNFNGQLDTAVFALSSPAVSSPSAKKNQSIKNPIVRPDSTQPAETGSDVQTQIIPTVQTKTLAASIADYINFETLYKLFLFAMAILIFILLAFTLYKIIKPRGAQHN